MFPRDVFQAAYGKSPGGVPQDLPAWIDRTSLESARLERLGANYAWQHELPERIDENAYSGQGSAGATPQVFWPRRTPEGDSIDYERNLLAFYMPFASLSRFWGIYWNEPAMLGMTKRLMALVEGAIGYCTPEWQAIYVRRMVRQHELVHFAVEYGFAQLTIAHPHQEHTPYLISRPRSFRDTEEAVATSVEMSCALWPVEQAGVSRAERSATAEAWQRIPLPEPYREWNQMPRGDLKFDRLMGSIPYAKRAPWSASTSSGGFQVRDALALAPKDPDIDLIPEYRVALDTVLEGPEADWFEPRYALPTPEQVIKHAKRAERQGKPSGVTVGPKTRHSVAVARAGKQRPVTLAPEKWDRIPHPVVGQLAALFDLERRQYLAEVSKL